MLCPGSMGEEQQYRRKSVAVRIGTQVARTFGFKKPDALPNKTKENPIILLSISGLGKEKSCHYLSLTSGANVKDYGTQGPSD